MENETVNDKSTIGNCCSSTIPGSLDTNLAKFVVNITKIDLSRQHLVNLDENIIFPPNLHNLNLSHNKFTVIPKLVLDLKDLKVLDVSNNEIQCFNNTPRFCHSLECLNMSSNNLNGPPHWIWADTPRKLKVLDLSGNVNLSRSFEGDYYENLLQLKTLVTHVKLYNCRLGKYLKFLGTFRKATVFAIGTPDWSCYAVNHLQEIPCEGIYKCSEIQKLDLSNTQIYTVTSNIPIFIHLKEINLSHNNLNGLPEEFCDLDNLEVCILSFNNFLYLPDNFYKLKKLTTLSIEVNELCMLPENICKLNLKVLDLYDNYLSEVPEELLLIEELDLAQNYLEEPNDEGYRDRKKKIRLTHPDRLDGRKLEVIRPESVNSPDTTDDESYVEQIRSNDREEVHCDPPSSPEDWDSDSHWVPHITNYRSPSPHDFWLSFVKKKMADGNLCPMDMHTVSVMEKVKYEKRCNPKVECESDGQFDDLTDDDS